MTEGKAGEKAICVFGDSFVDLVASVNQLPTWNTDTLASSITMHAGGSGGNTAAGCAALGVATTFVSLVGADGFGDFFLRRMERFGLPDCHKTVQTVKGSPTGTCIVLSGTDRGFVSCHGVNK